MSGLVYTLALFGCSHDATICERLDAQPQQYESRVSCEMAIATEMNQSEEVLRADHPTVVGECMTRGQLVRLGNGTVNLAGSGPRFASAETRDGA